MQNSVTESLPSRHKVLNLIFRTKTKTKPILAPNWPARVWGARAVGQEWKTVSAIGLLQLHTLPGIRDYIATIFESQDLSAGPQRGPEMLNWNKVSNSGKSSHV